MRVRIVAFATVAELLGERERSIDVPEGSDVGYLLDLLESSTPGFGPVRDRLAVAIDGRLATTSTVISADAEVALLPPVSGGAPPPTRRHLTRQTIDVETLTRESSSPECGAQLVFLGRVRSAQSGPQVTHLTYEAYEEMAEQALERICTDLTDESTGTRVWIVHRLGEVPLEEPSVAIVAASPHRSEAYEASRLALERLKKEVPVWKREHFEDGSSSWREEEALVSRTAGFK